MCTKCISGFWEWNGPARTPPPEGPRITMGTPSPQRYRLFAAKFVIMLKALAMKSMNWNSTMGLSPWKAAPMATPV